MLSVLSASRCMLAKLQLAPQDRASVLSSIATDLNEAVQDRLGRRSDGCARSPLEVMTGIELKRQVLRVLPPSFKNSNPKISKHARAGQVISIA